MVDAARVQRDLDEILADEIKAVPNVPQDMGTMRRIDKKAQQIRDLCQSIDTKVDTGDRRWVGQRLRLWLRLRSSMDKSSAPASCREWSAPGSFGPPDSRS